MVYDFLKSIFSLLKFFFVFFVSSIDLLNIVVVVYSIELFKRLKRFFFVCFLFSFSLYVNEFLVVIFDFERDFELWNIRFVNYIVFILKEKIYVKIMRIGIVKFEL